MNHKSTHFTLLRAFLALSALAPASMQLAHAQNASSSEPLNFSQLSTANVAPARLQIKSLTKGWQRLTIENDQDDPYLSIYGGFRGAMYQDVLAEAGVGVYFTKGQSVALGDQTFLVAYRVDTKMTAQDIQNLFRNMSGHGNDGPATGPRKFSPDTTLLLSLLNLKNVGSLKDVRAFNPKMDIMGPSDVIAESNENLEALGRYLVQISQPAYGQPSLPLRDPAALRQTFDRYFHPRQNIYVHPQSKEAYRTNADAVKTPFKLVSNRSRVIAIYEGRPGTDGKYGAVFLDGHVERIPSHQWKAIRAIQPKKPGAQEIRRLSDANLRQLHAQLLRYSRIRQGNLPRMQNVSQMRNDLINYTGAYNATYFTQPGNGQPYRPNALLSGKNLRKIANASRLVAFYEVTPDSSGKRAAIFLDGHIEHITSANWNRVRTVPVRLKPDTRKA